jgi:carboxymethylenebutenolidase
MIETQTSIATIDGKMSTFICHPERHGPHPVIILLMDAGGIREGLRDMARRLGTVGYYVMLPNLYYRQGLEELGRFPGDVEEKRQRALALIAGLTMQGALEDIDALIRHTDGDQAAAPGPMGCVGYCISGQFAINAAVRHPQRVRAAASFYGTSLITDSEDSPHLGLQRTDARLYFGCAEIDDWVPKDLTEQLGVAARSSSAEVEIELYRGAEHGFVFCERDEYHKQAAERHWERLFALFSCLA